MRMTTEQPRILFGWKAEWREGCLKGARRIGAQATMAPLPEAELTAFDAVIPITLDDHEVIERVKAAGERVRAISIPSAQRDLCDDKLTFAKRLAALGYGDHVPRHLEFGTMSAIDFPAVVKMRRSAAGRGTFIVSSAAELEAHIPLLSAGDAFLQELIPGDEEFAAHLLMHDGLLVFTSVIQYRMQRENLVKGYQHKPLKRQWLSQAPFKPLWHAVLRDLGLQSGTFCIDYRIRGGKPVIFEINPRLGASLTGNMSNYLRVYVSRVHHGPGLGFG